RGATTRHNFCLQLPRLLHPWQGAAVLLNRFTVMTTNYFAKLAAAAIIRVFSEPCEQGLVGINYRIRLSRCERGYGESRKRAGVRELVADERRRLPGDESVDRVGVIELEGSVVVVDAATVLALAALAVEVGPVGGGTVLSGHRGGGTVRELL